jgi:hypothetical protein
MKALLASEKMGLHLGGNLMSSPIFSESSSDEINELSVIIDQLRSADGCAWCAEQTHESLVRYLIEESYELIDAIESGFDLESRGTDQFAHEGEKLLGVGLAGHDLGFFGLGPGGVAGGVRRDFCRRGFSAGLFGPARAASASLPGGRRFGDGRLLNGSFRNWSGGSYRGSDGSRGDGLHFGGLGEYAYGTLPEKTFDLFKNRNRNGFRRDAEFFCGGKRGVRYGLGGDFN